MWRTVVGVPAVTLDFHYHKHVGVHRTSGGKWPFVSGLHSGGRAQVRVMGHICVFSYAMPSGHFPLSVKYAGLMPHADHEGELSGVKVWKEGKQRRWKRRGRGHHAGSYSRMLAPCSSLLLGMLPVSFLSIL